MEKRFVPLGWRRNNGTSHAHLSLSASPLPDGNVAVRGSETQANQANCIYSKLSCDQPGMRSHSAACTEKGKVQCPTAMHRTVEVRIHPYIHIYSTGKLGNVLLALLHGLEGENNTV